MRLVFRLAILCLLTVLVLALATLTNLATVAAPQPPQRVPPTRSPAVTPTTAGWLILPEFPANVTQAEVGAEIYRLVCQDCHGDRRQGLTAAWIATWPEEQQNCWTSKCHAANHPPDGFDLPRAIPAIGGPGALSRFATAYDLYDYIRTNMPWHNPGSLTEAQYWQLSAFLLREQGITATTFPLDEESARSLLLHPRTAATAGLQARAAAPAGTGFWWVTIAVMGATAVLTWLLMCRWGLRAGCAPRA